MGIIVQKYGGTSVADERSRQYLVAKVRKAREDGDQVVLVVSAMGRKGAPFATDTLLDTLRTFSADPDPLTRALLASCGETISVSLISAYLRSQGLPSVPMTAYTAGLRAQGPHEDAFPTEVNAKAIQAQLDAGRIPVITGFQAVNDASQIVTLGRGGSDTSAVAVGIGLKADYVDIYTDVPGVAKADPRWVEKADFIEFLDYDAMFRLAKHGARVLHDRSALLARLGGVLLRVRSTFDEGPGTLIGPRGYTGKEERYHSAPDFIGLASMAADANTDKITAIFSEGKGKAGIQRVSEAAGQLGLESVPCDDPDAVAVSCDRASTRATLNTIYAMLRTY